MKILGRFALGIALLAGAGAWLVFRHPLWVADQQIRLHLSKSHVHSRYIQAGGYRLHYFEGQPPDGSPGIPLVLVHGLGSRGEDWSPMIPTLTAQGFHIYAPDLLGYGRSPKPDVPYSISLEEDVLVDFMRAVGLTRADLDGWSMGGWIAAKTALDHPDLVDRLVLNDTVGIAFQPAFAPDVFLPRDPASFTRLVALLTPHPWSMRPYILQDSLRRVHQESWVVQRAVTSMESGADLLDTRLPSLTQPTLVIWGAEDRLIPLSVGESIHRLIPTSVLAVVPGCGHLVPSECAKPVLSTTIEFLTAHPPPQGGETTLPGQ